MLPPSYRNAEPREPVLRFPWAPTLAYLVLRAEVTGTHLPYSIIRTETPASLEAQCSSRRAKRRRRVVGTSARMGPLAERFATAPCLASSRLAEARSSAHPGASLSLSHSFQKRNTHPKERNVSEQRMCVFTSSCSNPILRENPQSSSLARQNFCGKLSKTFPLPAGGRPHRAGVRRAAAKRQRESLRSLTGRSEEDPRPTDRISAATRASYFGERSSLPALPRVCSRGEPKGHLWGSVFFLERGLDGEQPR